MRVKCGKRNGNEVGKKNMGAPRDWCGRIHMSAFLRKGYECSYKRGGGEKTLKKKNWRNWGVPRRPLACARGGLDCRPPSSSKRTAQTLPTAVCKGGRKRGGERERRLSHLGCIFVSFFVNLTCFLFYTVAFFFIICLPRRNKCPTRWRRRGRRTRSGSAPPARRGP